MIITIRLENMKIYISFLLISINKDISVALEKGVLQLSSDKNSTSNMMAGLYLIT